MGNLVDSLKMVRGAAAKVRVYLFDDVDAPESLVGFTTALMSITLDEDALPTVTSTSTVSGSDADGTYLEFDLLESETVLLVGSRYIADVRVTISARDYQTDRFYVELQEALSS